MDELPLDVLHACLQQLDSKTLARAATTCTRLRDAALEYLFKVTVSPRRLQKGMNSWLDKHAERIKSLTFCMFRYPALPILEYEDMPRLTSIRIYFCRVPASVVHFFPSNIEELVIHRLTSNQSGNVPALFLYNLQALKKLNITFDGSFGFVTMCLRHHQKLEVLELRGARCMEVCGELPQSLRICKLQAVDLLCASHPLPSHIISFTAVCYRGSINGMLAVMFDKEKVPCFPDLKTVCVHAPNTPNVSQYVLAFPNIKRLVHSSTWCLLHENLVAAKDLQHLEVDVKWCFIKQITIHRSPETLRDFREYLCSIPRLKLTTNGRPVDIRL